MPQNYGFKDISAVEFNLAKPGRIQLQGFEPIDKRVSRLDKDIAKVEKTKKDVKKSKTIFKQRFKQSAEGIFGNSIGSNFLFRR